MKITKSILIICLIFTASCATQSGTKKSKETKEKIVINEVSKRFGGVGQYSDSSPLMRTIPVHGFIGDLIIASLSNILDSAQVKFVKDDLNSLSKSKEKYLYFAFSESDMLVRSIIKNSLKNNDKKYPNITFVYVGDKKYQQEIQSYVINSGMSYEFMDIELLNL